MSDFMFIVEKSVVILTNMNNLELPFHDKDYNLDASHSDSDSDVVIIEKSTGEIIEIEDDDEACIQGPFVSLSNFLKKDTPYIKNPFCHLVKYQTWKDLQNLFPDLASSALYCTVPKSTFIPRGICVKHSLNMDKFRSKYPKFQTKVHEEKVRINKKRKRNDTTFDFPFSQISSNGFYQQNYYGRHNYNYGGMCSAFSRNNYYDTFNFGNSPRFYPEQENLTFQESQGSRAWQNRNFSRYPLENYQSDYYYQYNRRGRMMRARPCYTAANSRMSPYPNSFNMKRGGINSAVQINCIDKQSSTSSVASSSVNSEINNNHFELRGSSHCPDISTENNRRVEDNEVLTDCTELPAKKRKLDSI